MEETTFQDPQIKKMLSHFKIIKINVTNNSVVNKELMHHFNVIAPPTFLFFNKNKQPLDQLKTVGEVSSAHLMRILEQAE
jgi:thiol:disulfide interchange protein DsbD